MSVVIITHNRMDELAACLNDLQRQSRSPDEIIVVDNASTDGTRAMLQSDFAQIRIIHSAQNLGVPGGRNLGYHSSEADICVTLDDDALFAAPDALERVARYFETLPDLCCLSFEVRDVAGNVARHYVPRRDRKIITEDTPGAFFVGTGHAVDRRRFQELGGFWEKLNLYFGEEPDLAYRMLEANYSILHTPHIAVVHTESKVARPSGRRIYYGTRNTPWIALKNLPWYSVVTLTTLSWGYYGLLAIRHKAVRSFLKGMIDCISGLPDVYRQRRPVSAATIEKLRRYSGVYLY